MRKVAFFETFVKVYVKCERSVFLTINKEDIRTSIGVRSRLSMIIGTRIGMTREMARDFEQPVSRRGAPCAVIGRVNTAKK